MRIAMICSGLEPGRNGVGDYMRQLAGTLARCGHQLLLLALEDYHLTENSSIEETSGMRICRWSSSQSWRAQARSAERQLADFAPDWISLQFVNYGWHPKGLPLALPRRFKALCGSTRVHLMFHELWVSAVLEETVGRRLMGWLQQKLVIFPLIHALQPARMHCNIYPYAEVLRRRGYAAEVLPLFGNIPLLPAVDDLPPELASLGMGADFLLLGTFGSIYPKSLPAGLLTRMRALAQSRGKRLAMLAAGAIGTGEDEWRAAQQAYPDILFLRLGLLPPDAVSHYLSALDFGLATTPWALIGKSGSATTMLEHGLPVIVSRDDAVRAACRNIDFSRDADSQLACFGTPGFESWLLVAGRRPPAARTAEVARAFLRSLEHAQS